MSVADDEAVIANYYERDGWDKPDRIAPYDRVPGMYSIGNSNDLLVRSGKIVEGGGLDAASAYMRDVKLIERKPDVREFTTLLAIFKALPPTAPPDGARPEQYYDAPKFSKLNPKVQWSTDGGKFVLHYLLPFPGGGGGIVNPHIVRLFRWTLTISKDYKLAWRDEETTFNTTTQEIGGP